MHSNPLLSSLFELSQDWLVLLDLNGKHLQVSASFARAMGLKASAFVGQTSDELGFPDFFESIPLQTDTVQWHSLNVEWNGQAQEMLATRVQVRDLHGETSSILICARNAGPNALQENTLQENALQEPDMEHHLLKNILDSDPSAVCLKDAQGRFLLVNQALADLYQLTPEQILGKTVQEVNPYPQEVTLIEGQDREVVQTQTRKQFPPYAITAPDGTQRWLSTVKQPLFHAQQPQNYILGVSTDVTHLHETQEALKAREQAYQKLLQNAQRRTRELLLLDRIQMALANKLELGQLYHAVVDAITEQLGYSIVLMALKEEDMVVRVASRGYDQWPMQAPIQGTAAGKAIRTGQPVLLEDVTQSEDYFAGLPGVKSCISVPVFAGNQAMGALVIESLQRTLDGQDLALMIRVAEQLGLAIENTGLHEKTRQDLVRTRALYQVSQVLHHVGNQEALLEEICQSVMQAIPARWCLIYMLDFEHQRVEYSASTGNHMPPIERVGFHELQEGLTGWALSHQQAALSLKNVRDERESELVHHNRLMRNAGSIIVAPLIHQGQPIGTLTALNHLNDPNFTEADVDWLTSVAQQVALALVQRKLTHQVQHLAFHDALTGLPNRMFFEEHLKTSMARAKRQSTRLAVLFIDLDGFKNVNDTLGHQVGDLLLQHISERLGRRIRESDVFARMGGDEFAVVLNDLHDPIDAVQVAQKFLDLLNKPFKINLHELFISASIGISVFPEDGQEVSTLLSHADTAMYRAKSLGKNDIQSFTPELAEKVRERLSLEMDLRHALHRKEMQLHYQPIVDLKTLQVVGHEALLRWVHPEKGFIPPDRFIPVAEESGLINALGAWVLQEACRQNALWHNAGKGNLRIAVNISMIQFAHSGFMDTLKHALQESGLAPEWLELEITESVMLHDTEMVKAKLQALRKLGVRVSVDDFGTGYSSLKYLHELPIDTLKIDRSFVNGLLTHASQAALVKTIVLMAQSLGLNVVAEGIETSEQLQHLQSLGCSEAQGYHFCRPLPPAQLPHMNT